MAKTSDNNQENDPRYPSQQQDRFIVRLPDGMRDQIKAAAENNGRSMNAEIVSRLVAYEHFVKKTSLLELKLKRTLLARKMLETEASDLRNERMRLSEKLKTAIPRDQTLYVVLDADGHPLSWSEVMTHLGEIGRAAGFKIDSISARVFDSASASNDAREEHWWNLIQHYRRLRNKRAHGE